MNKKTSGKNIKFNHAKHLVRQGVLSGLMLFNTVGTPAQGAPRTTSTNGAKKSVATNQDKLSTPIKINSQQDIEKLFEYALPFVFSELLLEEVPVPYAYSDGGRVKKKSTVGMGSTFSPLKTSDYKNPDAKWYYIAINPKSFWSHKYSYEEMLQLVIGWGQYRCISQRADKTFPKTKSKTVLERMYAKLQGASLTPNEFSALYCAVYNCEDNIDKLLPQIRKNINNKITCANLIRRWWANAPHNSGTDDRCLFEALVFLNRDNFCNAMINMQARAFKTKSGKWTGGSCVNSTAATAYCGTVLTTKNCTSISNTCKKAYLGVLYSNGVSPAVAMSGLDKYFKIKITSTIDAGTAQLRSDYNKAIKLYKQEKYQQALNIFLDIQKRGGDGPDLLNDIAISYFKLGEYDKCIQICKKILHSGVHAEYAKACYNAGRAYEAQGNYTRALQNYENALKYYNDPDYSIAGEDPNVNYEHIYTTAINRVKSKIKSAQPKPAQKSATPKSNSKAKSKKSAMFFLAGMTVANKRRNETLPRKKIRQR